MKKNFKYKKLIMLSMLIFITSIFTGCAEVNYSRFVYSSGEIQDKVVVEIDQSTMDNVVDNVDLLAVIKTDLDNLYTAKISEFRNYISLYYEGSDKSLIVDNVTCVTTITTANNSVTCQMVFPSVAIYKMYNNYVAGLALDYSDDSAAEIFIEKGLFFNKYIQEFSNVYAGISLDTLAELDTKYNAYFKVGSFSLSDVLLTQIYASSDIDIKSNADDVEVLSANGIKMHYWVIDGDTQQYMLQFYILAPNTATWYMLALILSGFSVLVVYILLKTKKIKDVAGQYIDVVDDKENKYE